MDSNQLAKQQSFKKIIIIDNYDSFTYNLVQMFRMLDADVSVFYHDQVEIDELEALQPTHLCISPGPNTPKDAKVSMPAIQYFHGKIPILGICLGHQCLVELFGGKLERSKQIIHGKTSKIWHHQNPIFQNVPSPFVAMRYHSFIAVSESLPANLKILADTEEGEVMAVNLEGTATFGVQFHPESILTPDGMSILDNFLHNFNE